MNNVGFPWFSLALFLFATCPQLAIGVIEAEIYFENCTCTKLDKSGVLKHFTCSLTKSNRQRRTFNMEMQFDRDVDKLRVDVLISLPQRDQQQQQSTQSQPQPQPQLFGNLNLILLNVSRFNACALFNNRNPHDMIQWLRKPLLHFSNFPLRCPLVKQKMYFVRGLRFDAQLLPPLPITNVLQIDFSLADGNLKLFKGVTRLHYGTKNSRRG